MNIQEQIDYYISSQPVEARVDLESLHQLMINIFPEGKLWFLDGKNEEGKVVSNPNIGYGKIKISFFLENHY